MRCAEAFPGAEIKEYLVVYWGKEGGMGEWKSQSKKKERKIYGRRKPEMVVVVADTLTHLRLYSTSPSIIITVVIFGICILRY